MYDRELASFVPHVYKDVKEMDAIIESEQLCVTNAQNEMTQAFANTFVLSANEEGISMFEFMLGIMSNPSVEDLEFRRMRILNRITLAPPFTFRFLMKRLDDIIGKNKWVATLDFDNYTLYIESSALNQNWYQELEFTLNEIIPCNIIFTNVPLTALLMEMGEEISYRTVTWNYRLSDWALGRNPFALTEGGAIIKMENRASITSKLLHDTADFVKDDIVAVLINDEVKITDFRVKMSVAGTVTLEYEVTPAQVTEVTNIKLLDSEDNVLTESNVWVPVSQTILGKHTIRVREVS